MMINTNYTAHVQEAKANSAQQVHFDNTPKSNGYVSTTDTLTLSDAAIAKIAGNNVHQTPPTYIKPATASSLLAANQSNAIDNSTTQDDTFRNMMQSILDKRLGVDREQLAELEAMMEEIAKNENMSPEEKQKAIEQLEKMREELITESIENKKVATQTFQTNTKTNEQN